MGGTTNESNTITWAPAERNAFAYNIAVWVQSESNSFIPSGFIIHPIIRSSCAISLDAIEKGPDIAPRIGIVLPHLSTAIFAASAQFPWLPILVMQKLIGLSTVCK